MLFPQRPEWNEHTPQRVTAVSEEGAPVGDIAQRLIRIVAAKFALRESDLDLDTSYVGDLAANSIDAIELVMLIEAEFGVDISDKDAAGMTTLRDTIAYLSSCEITSKSLERGLSERRSRPR